MSDTMPPVTPSNSTSLVFIGQGEITLEPDISKINVGVQTIGNNLSTIEEENRRSSAILLESLNNLGIDNITTKEYSINRVYDYDSGGTRVDRGYIIRNILELTFVDVNNIGEVIDVAVRNGANVVENISFEVSNYDLYYQEALNNAILNAYEKAATVYTLLGHTQQPRIINIVENTIEPPSPPVSPALREGVYITPTPPEQTTIRASVTIDFI